MVILSFVIGIFLLEAYYLIIVRRRNKKWKKELENMYLEYVSHIRSEMTKMNTVRDAIIELDSALQKLTQTNERNILGNKDRKN